MADKSVVDLPDASDAKTLNDAFASEVRELNLLELKVYDLTRRVLYATHRDEIGSTENGDAFKTVIGTGKAGLVTKTLPDGSQQ
ncbi:MAG: hypothetical protein VW268_08115 [Rhodospirillaceae bacterium]